MNISRANPWISIVAIAVMLIVGMLAIWRGYACCDISGTAPIRTDADIEQALTPDSTDAAFRLTTGIFVQSLSFASAHDVEVTGRIWQRLPPGTELPRDTSMGVLFPDAITAHDSNLTPIYIDVALSDGARLSVWNFQVILRQGFDYSAYPLDGKLVWIRLWANDVENRLQLVPDLGAYASTQSGASMGISQALVSGEWAVRDSFFGFENVAYGTDFGRNTGNVSSDTETRPELRFHVVLQRNFTDAFLVNLVPLFVTFGLLFGLMMSVTRHPDTAGRLGFDTLAVFGSCAGLFFISLLGHIQIRQEFAGSQIVYIEYFYILSYIVLLFVSVFSFATTYSETPRQGWLLRGDGRNAKLFYWPAILLAVLAISVWQLGWG